MRQRFMEIALANGKPQQPLANTFLIYYYQRKFIFLKLVLINMADELTPICGYLMGQTFHH